MTPAVGSSTGQRGAPLLEVTNLSKTFTSGPALSEASLSIWPGEVVAVIGQNGSGKSTLVKVLAGVHKPDDGAQIRYRGQSLDPQQTEKHLHFIHQDLGLVPQLSAVENLSLGADAARGGLKPHRRDEGRRAAELIARFDAHFDVRVPISELSAAERTIVAIARALDGWERHDNVLVLDEPTAALHGDEVEKLLRAVRRVANDGAGVLFISHRLDEVHALADRVVVLRNSRVVGSLTGGEFSHDDLVRHMTGEEIAAPASVTRTPADDVALRADGVSGGAVRSASLAVRAGEIVGVAGVMGSGRDQLGSLLFGASPRDSGEVLVNGACLQPGDPCDAIRRNAAFVPADRRANGAVMSLTARENLTLTDLRPLRRRFGRLDRRRERAEAREWMQKVDVRPLEPERELSLFSGGNQQKVVLAKWLRREPAVLILDEPTQGVDVGAKGTIYSLIGAAARNGAAVLVASSESKELAEICDRVLVMRDGVIATELEGDDVTEARLVEESVGLTNRS